MRAMRAAAKDRRNYSLRCIHALCGRPVPDVPRKLNSAKVRQRLMYVRVPAAREYNLELRDILIREIYRATTVYYKTWKIRKTVRPIARDLPGISMKFVQFHKISVNFEPPIRIYRGCSFRHITFCSVIYSIPGMSSCATILVDFRVSCAKNDEA